MRAGLTPGEAASDIGRTESTYRRYENGELTPSPPTLAMLADLFGCPVGDLFDAADEDDAVTRYAAEITRVVAEAPPMTDDQRLRLRALLRGVEVSSPAVKTTRRRARAL